MKEDAYCNECGSCGEAGCCTPLKCAYNNMVKKSTGLHCEYNFNEIKFLYKLAEALYEKYQDEEIFDTVYAQVYEKENNEA